jgi:hypothetical protein
VRAAAAEESRWAEGGSGDAVEGRAGSKRGRRVWVWGIEGVGYNVGAGWWEGVCVNVARVRL